MATIPTSVRSRNLAEAHQRVRSPLERLRRFIRAYVSLEGAAVVGLYLTLWFWIGMVLDYGVFRLFHFDWVQETAWGVRCGVLVVLLSGLLAAVALTVLTRLFREFRDAALALVLERRYPKILGDRLITAVELADPRKAAEIGYSPAMVQETIHEAAQRVERLKIKEVFDWERLVRRGILIGLLVVGGYLVAVGLFCTANAMQDRGFTTAGFTQFHDVAGIWFERNILLRNVIWPRQAHLEYLETPPFNGEYRIGRGDRGPTIRVRALKYVIAGAPSKKAVESYRSWLSSRGIGGDEQDQLVEQFQQKPAEGWRALSWFDLTPELLGAAVPDIALPAEWKPREMGAGLTLDEIELDLDKTETHKTLAPETQEGLRNLLTQLEERANDPAMNRTLRKLTIPEEAQLIYKGNTTNSQTTMQRLADNEYTGQFGDLKETVTFTVQGLDYYTPSRKVVVVDPPLLEQLLREEERPAYLYYRLGRDDNPAELSGKKQRFESANVSLQGGEVSPIYGVPVGTNITLTATASKDLAKVWIEPHRLQKAGIPITASPPKMLDERTFTTRFENIRFEQNFLFKFLDTDGVTGQRQVVILPSEDAPPKIREFAPDKIARRVQGGYMVTVTARIPFLAEVEDDHGLNEVRYAYRITQAESGRFNRRAPWPLLGGASLNPAAQGPLPGLTDLVYLLQMSSQGERKVEEAPVKHYALPSFRKELDKRPDDVVQHPQPSELDSPKRLPYRQLLRQFSLKPDDWTQPELDPLDSDLPLWRTDPNLKMTDPSRPQPRYQMQLWLEAVDNDLDSEKNPEGRPLPHLRVSEERYTFFLVSENELLTEIAKEEEQLYAKLDERYQGLLDMQNKLAQINLDLSNSALKANELGAMSARTDQIQEMLEKAQNTTREVYTDYARILREMKANQVSERFLERVENTIVDPLKRIDGNFEDTRDAVGNFRTSLDSKEIEPSRKAGGTAKEQMLALTRALEKILASMQKMTDLNALIAIIDKIEKSEGMQYETIKKIYEDKVNDLFEQGTGGDKPEGKK
jgi:hypothetical protein